MMTFHQWKDRQVKADSQKHGVFRYYRDREWYYQAYGRYAARATLWRDREEWRDVPLVQEGT